MISRIFAAVSTFCGLWVNLSWPPVVHFLMLKIGITPQLENNLFWIVVTEPVHKIIGACLCVLIGSMTGIFFGLLVTNDKKGVAHRRELFGWLLLGFCFFALSPLVLGQAFYLVEVFIVGVKSNNFHIFSIFGFVGGFSYIAIRNFSIAHILGFDRYK